MSDLRDLYQDVILDHSKRPRNFKRLDDAKLVAQGRNPLCGDRLEVYVEVENGRVKDIGFVGNGCAISTASASMMTELLKGKTVADAREAFDRFHALLTSDGVADEVLGKLAVFAGVREFPVRIKCATLPWHTLRAALERADGPVSTE